MVYNNIIYFDVVTVEGDEMTLYKVTWYRVVSSRVTWFGFTWYKATWHRVTLSRVTWYRGIVYNCMVLD